MAENTYGVFDLLIENELSLKALYDAYSLAFNDYASFWKAMSEEENQHAQIITKLKEKCIEKRLAVKEGRFKTALLKSTIEYLKREVKKAENKEVDFLYAVTNTFEIEKSMIERYFFEVLDIDPLEVKTAINFLNESTRRHLERVKILWEDVHGRKL